MKEPDIEGVATHDVPESCAVDREVGGEALTGVRAGRLLSREITLFRVPTLLINAEGNTNRHRQRAVTNDPARSQTPCTFGTSLHENRESFGLLGVVARRDASGRP
jgi:RNA-directed DNA polymerase